MFNSDLTKHLAELSKLEFTDEELEQIRQFAEFVKSKRTEKN